MPASPVVGVPGILDAGDQMRLAVRVSLVAAQDGPRRGQDRLILRNVAP